MIVVLAFVLHASCVLAPLQDAGTGPAQGAPTPEPGKQAGTPKGTAEPAPLPQPPRDLPPLEAPEALPAGKIEELGRVVSRLRAGNAAALKEAQGEVIAFGRPALPVLAKSATTNHAGQMESLVVCMTALADYRDRDFVEASLTSPLPVMRRFAARKVGEYAIPQLVDKLPPMLEDKDADVRFEAMLALMANGREDGLAIAALAFAVPVKTGRGSSTVTPAAPVAVPGATPPKERVLAVLPRVAGQGRHEKLEAMLRIDPEREKEEAEAAAQERLTAVLLLHAIGDVAAQTLLVKALDDKHNVVQREAINSLRDLLEHQGPLDKSSIFQQINEVKRLKDVWAAR